MLGTLSIVIKAIIIWFFGFASRPYLDQYFKYTDKKINKLEEAYSLCTTIYNFSTQLLNVNLLTLHYLQQNNFERGITEIKNIATIENPFPKIKSLLDFHLDAPYELLNKTTQLEKQLLLTMRPIAESINNSNKRSQLAMQATNEGIKTSEQAQTLQVELIQWIKEEKKNTLRKSDVSHMISAFVNYLLSIIKKLQIPLKKLQS